MRGETNLSILLGTMTASLADDVYVFVTLAEDAVPENLVPRMKFIEAEGTTLIVTAQEATDFGLACEFRCRMITLNVHSSLEAVGFIAVVATELAKLNMGVNPVSGFFHDHLFVPEGREKDAMDIVARIASQHANS